MLNMVGKVGQVCEMKETRFDERRQGYPNGMHRTVYLQIITYCSKLNPNPTMFGPSYSSGAS